MIALRIMLLIILLTGGGCSHTSMMSSGNADTPNLDGDVGETTGSSVLSSEGDELTGKSAAKTDNRPPSVGFKRVDLIDPGDRVHVEYTCRTSYDWSVVASNLKSVEEDPTIRKSNAFNYSQQDVNLELIAGKPSEPQPENELIPFEIALRNGLAKSVVGLINGKKLVNTVSADEAKALPDDQREISLAIKRKVPKTQMMDRGTFSKLTGIEPKVGATVDLEREFNGKIVTLTDQIVEVAFQPKSQDELSKGPFGPIRIHDKGTYYEREIVAEEGTLVRSGPLVGRITGKQKGMFQIDYGHPFGGYQLSCDILPRRITDNEIAAKEIPVSEEADKPLTELTPSDKTLIAEQGDLAGLTYTASTPKGGVIFTNDPKVLNNASLVRSEYFYAAEPAVPEAIIAGQSATVPGVEKTVIGMSVGDCKDVVLDPLESFGLPSPRLVKTFPRRREMPAEIGLPANEFVKRYGFLPKENQHFAYNPYVEARVMAVNEQGARLRLSPRKETVVETYGLTTVTDHGDTITIALEPTVGAVYTLQGKTGKIVSADKNTFTTDFNNPLAGEQIHVQMKLETLTKSEEFQSVPWFESYDQGLSAALESKKPAVLLLYADWCKWCKRMLTESFEDPRIKMMKDNFVWIKVNSDKDQGIKEMFGQKGFPMTVLLNSQGGVVTKLDGFQDATNLKQKLEDVLHGKLQTKTSIKS